MRRCIAGTDDSARINEYLSPLHRKGDDNTRLPMADNSEPSAFLTVRLSRWKGMNQLTTSEKKGNDLRLANVLMNTSPPSSCILLSSLILSAMPDLSSSSCHSGFSSRLAMSPSPLPPLIFRAMSGRSFNISGNTSSCILRLMRSVSRERMNCRNTSLTSLLHEVSSRNASMR